MCTFILVSEREKTPLQIGKKIRSQYICLIKLNFSLDERDNWIISITNFNILIDFKNSLIWKIHFEIIYHSEKIAIL